MKTPTKIAIVFGVLWLVLMRLTILWTPSDIKELEAMGRGAARTALVRTTVLQGGSVVCLLIAIGSVVVSAFRKGVPIPAVV
ncbi:MAG: hypothetical protein ACREYE_22165 [Gammaproteobacteria bacterium]